MRQAADIISLKLLILPADLLVVLSHRHQSRLYGLRDLYMTRSFLAQFVGQLRDFGVELGLDFGGGHVCVYYGGIGLVFKLFFGGEAVIFGFVFGNKVIVIEFEILTGEGWLVVFVVAADWGGVDWSEGACCNYRYPS